MSDDVIILANWGEIHTYIHTEPFFLSGDKRMHACMHPTYTTVFAKWGEIHTYIHTYIQFEELLSARPFLLTGDECPASGDLYGQYPVFADLQVYIRTYIHIWRVPCKWRSIWSISCVCRFTGIHTYIHTYMHACMHAYLTCALKVGTISCVCRFTGIRTYKHTNMHA